MSCIYMARIFSSLVLVTVFLLCGGVLFAQTTSFTYQGRLTDGGTAANATYDMQFKLYDAATGGNLQGSPNTVTNSSVTVTNGAFTVQLNFGDGTSAFPGADRYIEVNLRPAGSTGPYQQLLPRQQTTSSPYAIRALSATTADAATNALQLGGQPASQYVQTNSGNFVQNGTTQQTSANFSIDGSGTAGGTLSANFWARVRQHPGLGCTLTARVGSRATQHPFQLVPAKASPSARQEISVMSLLSITGPLLPRTCC